MESLVHGMLSNAVAVTVLAVLVAMIARLCRRPALIHSVCLLAMLKLIAPPVVSLPMPVFEATNWLTPSEAPRPPGEAAADLGVRGDLPIDEPLVSDELDGDWLSEGPTVPDDAAAIPAEPVVASWSWEAVALLVMMAGALAWWVLASVRIVRFHRLLRDVEPMPAEWQAEADALAARLGLRRVPRACLAPGDVPPMLWAFGRSVRLLVPSRLWATLGHDERTALLLHELAHLKRRDHWVRWGELAVVGLYWWHPAVWWIRRALREAEEQCCDAWVVWAMPHGGNKTYAAALVAALEFLSGARTPPAAAASATLGNGHVSSLKRRLRMIVKAKTPRGLSWAGRLAVAGLSALLLPLAPSWGQRDDATLAYAELDHQLRAIDAQIAGLERIGDQVVLGETPDRPGDENGAKAAAPRAIHRGTEAEYAAAATKLFRTDLQLMELRASLDMARTQLARAQDLAAARGEARARLEAQQLEDRIREEFKKDPAVKPLIEQIDGTNETLKRVKGFARHASDPALVAAQKQREKLLKQWNALWEQKHDEIMARLGFVGQDARPAAWSERIKAIEAQIDQKKTARDGLKETIVALKLQDAKDKDDQPREARTGEATERLKENLQRELDNLDGRIKVTTAELTELVRSGNLPGRYATSGETSKDFAQNVATRLNNDLIHLKQQREVVEEKLARVADEEPKDDEKDAKPKEQPSRHEATDRIEQELKDLKEKLGKDLDPVSEAVRKSLERSLSEIHQALKKEGMTADDLRRAVEKSHRELRESLRRGGPVETELRGAAERARKDMQEAMDRQMREALRGHEEMTKRAQDAHEQQKKMADGMRDQMRQQMDRQRKAVEERQAETRRQAERMRETSRNRMRRQAEARKDVRARAERSKAEEKRAADDREKSDRSGSQHDELDAARKQVHELQAQLREANDRLERLQRREPHYSTTLRSTEPAARPAPPAPATPARPDGPGRIRDRDDHERRLREIEDKMDRLLKELQEIKGRTRPGARTS